MNAVPLNPADHFTLVMDHEIRDSGLGGNYCGIVLDLNTEPDHQRIKDACVSFAHRFPLSVSRLLNQGRKYFWTQIDSEQAIPYYRHRAESGQAVDDLTIEVINRAATISDSPPVELHYLRDEQCHKLVLRWFHPALDAKGAELVLHHLFEEDSSNAANDQSIVRAVMSDWSLWKKFKLAYKAKKNISRLDRMSTALPNPNSSPAKSVGMYCYTFDEEASKTVMSLARKNAGITGTTLYMIGSAMRALSKCAPDKRGEAYCVPYAVNMRKRKSLAPVFGNQVTFLFSQVPCESVDSREKIFSTLKEQNKSAVKEGLDRAMLPLMEAGSWLSLAKYGKIVRYAPNGGERSSFWFSFTGEMEPRVEEVAGAAIRGMSQFTQVSAPPGLSILVNQYRGCLTLSINYVAEQFSQAWIKQFTDLLRRELSGECETE